MPRTKSLQALFLESVLFISLFALVGHVSVNFWERYMIQSELTKMKTSLYSLKETVNTIGIAYDNLHRELIVLAELTDTKPQFINDVAAHRKDPDKFLSKDNYNLDRRTRHDIKVKARLPKTQDNDKQVNISPTTADEITHKLFEQNQFGVNAATVTKFHDQSGLNKEKIDAKVATTSPICQGVAPNFVKVNIPKGKNATTITRYPVISTGVGKNESRNPNQHLSCRSRNIHQCHKDESKCSVPYKLW